MNAGRRNTLIAFQRAAASDDGYTETLDWDDPVALGSEWAEVNYGRGDERRQAAMEQGAQPATFRVLDNALTRGLTLSDRIVADGQSWDITSNVPGRKRGDRDITAIRSA